MTGASSCVSREKARYTILSGTMPRWAVASARVSAQRPRSALLIAQAALRAVEEELLVHAGVAHEGVVTLHGANLSPPKCCIVMECCDGSLFERCSTPRTSERISPALSATQSLPRIQLSIRPLALPSRARMTTVA